VRAVVVREFGGPELVEILEVGVPVPGPEEVLVKVHAAPVTPVDLDTRSGELAGLLGTGGYYPLGREAAGTVTEAGSLVSEFEVGDEVVGWCDNLLGRYAAQADYVLFSAACCAHAPTGVSLLEASTLPLNGLTADQALDAFDPGRSVLITGAAGGVGAFAVQLAVLRNFEVFATAHPDDEAYVRRLGAHHFIPRTADLNEAVRAIRPAGVAGLLDTAVTRDIRPVADNGRFVTLVVGGEPDTERGIKVSTEWTSADRDRLRKLTLLAELGDLKMRVGATYSLDEAAKSHERFARGRLGGHLVLLP
jgi:NADPH:quinone reductase